MQALFTIIFLLFSAYSFTQQVKKSKTIEYKNSTTIICGNTYEIPKQITYSICDYSQCEDDIFLARDTLSIKENKFKLTFQLNHPVYITFTGLKINTQYFSDGKQAGGILIEPGDSIFIDTKYSGWGFENIQFRGRGAEKLWCVQQLYRTMQLYENPELAFSNKMADRRIGLWDSINNSIEKTIDIYKHKLSIAAQSLIKTDFALLHNPDISDIVLWAGLNSKDYKTKSFFKINITKSNQFIDITNPALMYSIGVDSKIRQRLLLQYSINKNISFKEMQKAFKKDYYDYLITCLSKNPLKDRLIVSYLISLLKKNSLDQELKASIEDYLSNGNKNTSFYQKLNSRFLDYKNRLAKGASAFPFTLMDSTDKLHKMQDFIGKVVLIDFMFHPCQGCAKMEPYLEQIHEQFKTNKDVVFIAISIDANKEWRKYQSSTYKCFVPGSLFLYTNGQGENHPVIKHYEPQYPTLVLIDKKGKLVSARAPDPRRDNGKSLAHLITETLNTY